MHTEVDYAQRAAECRRLATQYAKPEHRGHFLEMAENWEMMLNHQREKQERTRQQAVALADRFRSILSLSDVAANEPPKENNNETAPERE
jgi:hypothetical protein